MAFLSGIFSAPAPSPAQPNQQGNQQPNNQQQPAPNQQQGQPNPEPPNNAAAQPKPANSSMDTLMQLMTPSKEVVEARNKQNEMQQQGIFPEVKPEQIQASLANADFTTGIAPELAQKALGGDVQSLMQLINTASRNAVASSMQLSQGLVEHGVKTGQERFSSTLDSRFRDLQLRNQNVENPALNHPLAKGMLQSIAAQIANANPKLSPSEVTKQAETHFLQFAKDLSAPTPAQESLNKPPEKDWLRYLEDGSTTSSNVPPNS